jgi:hypothetical protein
MDDSRVGFAPSKILNRPELCDGLCADILPTLAMILGMMVGYFQTNEERELLIAHSNQGRVVLVSYTLRTDVVRIISARKATKAEEVRYAQGI